jgi:zinc and cadmium transporter
LAWIVSFSLLGGLLSVLGASAFLTLSDARRGKILPHVISFATGSLLGAAFLALLPEALENPTEAKVKAVTLTVLLGLLMFFLLEKMVIWRHCHFDECEGHTPHDHSLPGNGAAAGTLILVGDSIHNFVDGVLIAAAFLSDIKLGIVTSLAVAAHEIPQEVGDFAILLHSGFTRRKALVYNLLSGMTAVLGALLAWFSLSHMTGVLPYILAIAAASFTYVAVADLIPGMHEHTGLRDTTYQAILIALGVLWVYGLHQYLH